MTSERGPARDLSTRFIFLCVLCGCVVSPLLIATGYQLFFNSAILLS